MTDDEVLTELLRRLRVSGDPEAAYVDGAVLIHRWDDAVMDPPPRLHASVAELGDRARIDEDTRVALWPDTAREHAGLNLLLVHVEETIATRVDDTHRHLVLGTGGVDAVANPPGPPV